MNIQQVLNNNLKDQGTNSLPSMIVSYVLEGAVPTKLNPPRCVDQIRCSKCNGSDHYTCYNDPHISGEIAWFCANPECIKYFSELSKIKARKDYEERFFQERKI